MLIAIAAALLALHPVAADTTPALPADAFLDARARELVEGARQRRQTVDRSVAGYQAVARERVSLGLRAVGRDRTAFVHETAARIDWRRGEPTRIELLGARQATPIVTSGVRVPDGLRRLGTHLAFNPSDTDLVTAVIGSDETSIRHPLATGSEAHYRFRAGGETTLRLPDGRTIRLLELEVIPRRNEFTLASGSLWLEEGSYALVRAVVRPARPWDMAIDADDDDEVPGFVKPIRGEIRFITIDYGLWDMRWWMPRLIAFEGAATVGILGGGGTIRYERTYGDYRVRGADVAAAEAEEPVLTSCPKEEEEGALVCECRSGRCGRFEVVVPADTASLLASEHLPHPIHASGPALLTDRDLRQIGEMLERIRPPVWQLDRPTVDYNVAGLNLLRYNRVEGLSAGARVDVGFGPLAADATVRLGVADREPNAELGVERGGLRQRLRVAAFRRLDQVDPDQRALGLGNSLLALGFGRDDGDYFRTLGVELTGTPPLTSPEWFRWRLFAEQQREARKETDFSIPHLLDGDRDFRPNLPAERADQAGAAVRLRTDRGDDPAGFRWGADLLVEGSTGTFDFARPALTLRGAAPLPGRFRLGVEAAGGTSVGDVPLQSLWYLGGAGSVRGYAPLAAGGNAFWRARAEVGNQLPGARWVLFSDAGWAGARDAVDLDPELLSAGIGASFLDGLLRVDLARPLRGASRQWRAELYFNGTL